jgi:hypothetical protein
MVVFDRLRPLIFNLINYKTKWFGRDQLKTAESQDFVMSVYRASASLRSAQRDR